MSEQHPDDAVLSPLGNMNDATRAAQSFRPIYSKEEAKDVVLTHGMHAIDHILRLQKAVLSAQARCVEMELVIKDIARQPEGDEESAQSVARAYLSQSQAQPAVAFDVDAAFERALNTTMPPLGEAAKLRWWFEMGATAALSSCPTATPAQEPPQGYQLVPVEPTPDMLEATWSDESVMAADGVNQIRAAMYRAMLNAAPTTPAQEPVACQYAIDVAMPEYRCAVKCQYTTPQPNALLEAAEKYMAAQNRYAKADMAATTARDNYIDFTPELNELEAAASEVSSAEKELSAAIEALYTTTPSQEPVPQGWNVYHPEPWEALTEEAQRDNRIRVERNAAPFCGPDGVRIWSAQTLDQALAKACNAIGIMMPSNTPAAVAEPDEPDSGEVNTARERP